MPRSPCRRSTSSAPLAWLSSTNTIFRASLTTGAIARLPGRCQPNLKFMGGSMVEHAEGVFPSEPTKEALELMPTGLFLLPAPHDGEDNWQFVQRGLGITAGPP